MHVTFVEESDRKDTYVLCMKYCLQVNSYKHDDGEKFCGNMQIMLRTENLYVLLNKFFEHENKTIIITTFIYN
jgi:hypothetical protein